MLTEFKLCAYYPTAQDHKVNYSNRNNSAADCSLSLKFGTNYHHVTDDTLQMFKVKGQRSRSQRNVTYHQ